MYTKVITFVCSYCRNDTNERLEMELIVRVNVKNINLTFRIIINRNKIS